MIRTYEHNGQTYTIRLERRADGTYTAHVNGPAASSNGNSHHNGSVASSNGNGDGNSEGDSHHNGGSTYNIEAARLNGGWLLSLDGERMAAHTAAQGNERFVHVGGQGYTLNVPDARIARRKRRTGGGDLTAQMPGQVVDVLVNEGETVERGQTLIVMEAMKMEVRISAPEDGVVKKLLVGKGDVVERKQPLAKIEAQ